MAEQARAVQVGFAGVITKPIDAADLKAKISRALKLDTVYKYFQQQDGLLMLRLPNESQKEGPQDVLNNLDAQLAATVDAGGDKLIIMLDEVQTMTVSLIELAEAVIEASQALVAPLRGGPGRRL